MAETHKLEVKPEKPDEGEALGGGITPELGIVLRSAAEVMANRPKSGSTDESMPPGVGLAL